MKPRSRTLLPCPFCGGRARWIRLGVSHAVTCSVDEPACNVNTMAVGPDKVEVRAWNTRNGRPR